MEQGIAYRVDGLDETVRMLTIAPRNIVASSFARALHAAGQVFIQAIWPRVPIDAKAALNAAHGGKGVLVGGLDAWVQIDSALRGGSVDVGFGGLGHIADWVEYGHAMKGHRITVMKDGQVVLSKKTGKALKTKIGQKVLGEVAPHPFMRPAADASAEAAIDAFASSMRDSMRSGVPGVSTAA